MQQAGRKDRVQALTNFPLSAAPTRGEAGMGTAGRRGWPHGMSQMSTLTTLTPKLAGTGDGQMEWVYS
jgi:hypothetical protein